MCWFKLVMCCFFDRAVLHDLDTQVFLAHVISWARNESRTKQTAPVFTLHKNNLTKLPKKCDTLLHTCSTCISLTVRENCRHFITPYQYVHLKSYRINIFPYSYLDHANRYNSNHKSLYANIDWLSPCCLRGVICSLQFNSNALCSHKPPVMQTLDACTKWMTNIEMNLSSANKTETLVYFTAYSITRGFVYLGFHNWNHILGSSHQSKLC